MSPKPRCNACNVPIDGDRQVIEWESDLATDQQRSVVATFDTLLDQLERDLPKTYDVLRILSFFDPEDIPLAMLTDGARMASSLRDQPLPRNSQHESIASTRSPHHSRNDSGGPSSPTYPSPELRSLVSVILSPTAFPKALHKLQSVSLIEPLSRDGGSSLRMHDLVHSITLEHVKRHTAYQAWLDSAVSLVCGVLKRVEDPESPQSWPECDKLMPHMRSLNKVWAGVEGVNLQLVEADVRLAQYLNSRGRYDDAEMLCERGVGLFQRELGEKHKATLDASYVLAQIYNSQRRFAKAEEAFKHVLAVRQTELGADHPDTVKTTHQLAGMIYGRPGHDNEAEELFKRILAVNKEKLGLNHPDTLTTMNNLAVVYRSQERYDEAVELYKDVLAREEKTRGPDHIHTLAAANNLAFVYLFQRKYSEAEELFKCALVGREKLLGPGHPDTLTTVFHLAVVLFKSQGRDDEAEPLFLRALTGMKQHLGADHLDTLLCAKLLSDFYRSLGRNVDADALLGR
jgi:tetratricopeptide (TPR) repeat protein